MRNYSIVTCLLLVSVPVHAQDGPIGVGIFRDSINHWYNGAGRDRDDPRYDPEEYRAIADTLVALQNADGGWGKNVDWLVKLPPETIRELAGDGLTRSTFDNRNVYAQIGYLGEAYRRSGVEAYRESAARGLDYVFREQRPSGGWRGRDVEAITYNDDVMSGIMNLLIDVTSGDPRFTWIDDVQRQQAEDALRRAVDATLACQILVDGQRTAWCQQHDHETFAPIGARTFELASISGAESVDVVQVLMRLPPEPEIVDAIDSAVAWFREAALHGIRIERVPIPEERLPHHTAREEKIVVEDPNAPPLWARFYEIGTNRPFFADRDGVKVYQLSEIGIERRTGYAWYGTWPAGLLETEYPAWKARVMRRITP